MPNSIGASLKGWSPLGSAQWSTAEGDIVASAKNGAGFLLLDHSYQDAGIHALFKVTGGEIGFAFRLEKISDGMKGVMVSIKDQEIASYQIVLDAQGKEVSRQPLRYAGSIVRLAPPPPRLPTAAAAAAVAVDNVAVVARVSGGARGNSPSPDSTFDCHPSRRVESDRNLPRPQHHPLLRQRRGRNRRRRCR